MNKWYSAACTTNQMQIKFKNAGPFELGSLPDLTFYVKQS